MLHPGCGSSAIILLWILKYLLTSSGRATEAKTLYKANKWLFIGLHGGFLALIAPFWQAYSVVVCPVTPPRGRNAPCLWFHYQPSLGFWQLLKLSPGHLAPDLRALSLRTCILSTTRIKALELCMYLSSASTLAWDGKQSWIGICAQVASEMQRHCANQCLHSVMSNFAGQAALCKSAKLIEGALVEFMAKYWLKLPVCWQYQMAFGQFYSGCGLSLLTSEEMQFALLYDNKSAMNMMNVVPPSVRWWYYGMSMNLSLTYKCLTMTMQFFVFCHI